MEELGMFASSMSLHSKHALLDKFEHSRILHLLQRIHEKLILY
jgi:hypothetical protein